MKHHKRTFTFVIAILAMLTQLLTAPMSSATTDSETPALSQLAHGDNEQATTDCGDASVIAPPSPVAGNFASASCSREPTQAELDQFGLGLTPAQREQAERRAAERANLTDEPYSDLWCQGLGAQWWYYRTEACQVTTVVQRVYEYTPRPKQVASITYLLARLIESDTAGTAWRYYAQYYYIGGTGEVGSISLDPYIECRPNCTTGGTAGPISAQSMQLANPEVIEDQMATGTNFTIPGVGVKETETQTYVIPLLFRSIPIVGNAYRNTESTLRCDNLARVDRYPGCVFPESRPYFDVSRWPEAAQHVADAIYDGLPGGQFDYDHPLHRSTNDRANNANRKIACPRNFPTGANQSCDEYPFASTKEGAASGGRYSARAISNSDNVGSGAGLGQFYGNERVLDGDAFIVDPGYAASCYDCRCTCDI